MARIHKVNHQIQRIISQIIQEQIDNPNIGLISIVRVDTTPDLRFTAAYSLSRTQKSPTRACWA